ncbi:MAG: hypothetical protein KDB14_17230 [Planctomycetales bacterium]|nr:hypothetical protein [Planctomycetales bacterium]
MTKPNTTKPMILATTANVLRIATLMAGCLALGISGRVEAQDVNDVKAESLTVHLQSGRVFTAPVDQKTDDQHLWLRFEGRSVHLLRPIAWHAIVEASYAGQPISLAQLKAFSSRIQTQRTLIDGLDSYAPAGATHAAAAHRVIFDALAKPAGNSK